MNCCFKFLQMDVSPEAHIKILNRSIILEFDEYFCRKKLSIAAMNFRRWK